MISNNKIVGFLADLKRKKPKAQRKAFEVYGGYLFRICSRYLGQKELAEDVLSQVFLKMFEHIATTNIVEEHKFKAWAKRIAINECLQEIRKQTLFTESLEMAEMTIPAEVATDSDLLREDIVQFIQKLPLGYRTVFSLYVIEGYSHQEIAERLGISEGTSKSQLSKARVILKTALLKNEMV